MVPLPASQAQGSEFDPWYKIKKKKKPPYNITLSQEGPQGSKKKDMKRITDAVMVAGQDPGDKWLPLGPLSVSSQPHRAERRP